MGQPNRDGLTMRSLTPMIQWLFSSEIPLLQISLLIKFYASSPDGKEFLLSKSLQSLSKVSFIQAKKDEASAFVWFC